MNPRADPGVLSRGLAGIWGKKLCRRLGIVVAAFAALVIVGSALAAQPTALTRSSAFDSTNEGWYVLENDASRPATWQSTGGNPGGYISAQFPSGSGQFESVPASWPPGNALGDYGGTVGADVRVKLASGAEAQALEIGFHSTNSSVAACEYLEPWAPSSIWSAVAVTLDPNHLSDCNTPRTLTGAQLRAALAGFDGIFVFAGNVDGVSETVDVDNAQLAGPQAAKTAPTGSVTRKFTLTHSRRTFRGTLTARYDYSCAGNTKVTIYRKAKRPVKVGTARASAPNLKWQDGPATFSFKVKKVVKGSYYASARKAKSGLDGNSCVAAKSKTVKAR